MLEGFQRKLSRASDAAKSRVNIVHSDIRDVDQRYDWVVANFFLNVFPSSQMLEMVDVLIDKCKDRGSLLIGDFFFDARASGWVRMLQKLNWYLALSVFRIFVENSKHPLGDYKEHLKIRGWERDEVKKFGLLGVSFYQAERFSKTCYDD
jgi:hypothetical protein